MKCFERLLMAHIDSSLPACFDPLQFVYRRVKEENTAPIYINGAEIERVESVQFLGVTISDNLPWSSHVPGMVKKAQQCFFFLRQLRKFGMPIRSLTNSYRCTIESILSRCITASYGNCSAQDRKKLQKV
eukprot:g19163.t1